MRRSGSHAIMNWILSLFPPQTSCFYQHKGHMKPSSPIKTINLSNKVMPFIINDKLENQHILMYNNENVRLRDILDFDHTVWDKLYGKPETRYDVLIVRDPLNCFSSIAKRGLAQFKNPLIRHRIISTWKEHAYELKGNTDILPFKKVLINYNKWVTDSLYRKYIASMFTGSNNNEEWVRVSSLIGGGSSFTHQKKFKLCLENKTNDLQFLFERYKETDRYKYFPYFFQDQNLLDLVKDLFDIEYNLD